MAREAERLVGDFDVQDLANTGWAFAKVSQSDMQLFTVLAKTAEQRLGDFNLQNVANTV